MEQRAIKALLEQVAAGQVDVNDALLRLKMEPFEELGFASWTATVASARGWPR